MTKERKSRAFNPRYESPSQGIGDVDKIQAAIPYN